MSSRLETGRALWVPERDQVGASAVVEDSLRYCWCCHGDFVDVASGFHFKDRPGFHGVDFSHFAGYIDPAVGRDQRGGESGGSRSEAAFRTFVRQFWARKQLRTPLFRLTYR